MCGLRDAKKGGGGGKVQGGGGLGGRWQRKFEMCAKTAHLCTLLLRSQHISAYFSGFDFHKFFFVVPFFRPLYLPAHSPLPHLSGFVLSLIRAIAPHLRTAKWHSYPGKPAGLTVPASRLSCHFRGFHWHPVPPHTHYTRIHHHHHQSFRSEQWTGGSNLGGSIAQTWCSWSCSGGL